jgi:serine/threonine protein kinase
LTRPTKSNRINIVRKVGQGGQGAVFEAIAPNGDTVAVKRFTPPSGTPDSVLENYRTRFRREIEVTSRLAHRNIVEVLSDNLNADVPYYVMTWAETTLAALIANSPHGMPVKQALSLMIEVCQGIAYAHANDTLHRDIKPENVLIVGGIPKIADFGLGRSLDSASATLTQSQIGWGTVYYVAPEQMTSLHDAKKPSDVYSLGVVLFQMTTGLPPHQARIQAN